jgi:hypothetical protein
MPDDWTTQFTQTALAKVDAFIAEHPEYTRRDLEQPGQGATNRVVFARRGHNRVVFKVFCQAERKERECYALHHWRETGLVPKLLVDMDDTTIVMSHIPGVYLGQARQVDGATTWRSACRETGKAIGSLTRVPLSAAERAAFESRFYDGLGTLEAYLGRILELGTCIHARDPDFQDRFWQESLDLIQAQLAGILAQPRVLSHQDPANLHVQQGRFMGFFDLEMCRVGCAAMQLASAVGMLEGESAAWEPFREGWEMATGRSLGPGDLQAALAANHLLHWREISRYLSYDGTPGSGYDWASPADPVRYRQSIQAVASMLAVQWRQQ